MAAVSTVHPLRIADSKSPGTSQSNLGYGQVVNTAPSVPPLPPAPLNALPNPSTVHQQIHDMSSKRISTLDYMRKAHDGQVYWFNTILFTKPHLSRMPYFESKKLARRATNYLLLGLSIPNVLDSNSSNPYDYLRALNTLLGEFESYQQIHPPDGPSASSLSRARIPQMFKRATHTGVKARRTSSATDIGLPLNSGEFADARNVVSVTGPLALATSSFHSSDQDLIPGEGYTYLLTPSLPFDPDFFEIFATLCDVLIDCYTRVISLTPSPAAVSPGTGELFAKADTKLRKIMVTGIVKEFEDASRGGAKAELAGLSRVVLGGLI